MTHEANSMTQVMTGLANALGVSPLSMEISEPEIIPIKQLAVDSMTDAEKDALEDFKTSRDILIAVIANGKEALDRATFIAKTAQTPAAFDVVSKLVKAVAEANRGLLALHEAKVALVPDHAESEEEQPTVVNNTIIVSSPAELIALVDAQRKKNALIQLDENQDT